MGRSSWTEVNDLNSGRRLLITTGTATAALSFGGNTPDTAKTEIWNGRQSLGMDLHGQKQQK